MLHYSIVIIGGGHAGCQTAFSLRQLGHGGSITLVDDEGELPYQRPPLSKAYLTGAVDEPGLRFKPAAFYDQQHITLLHGTVAHIDRAAREVQLTDGRALPYEHLVLATGARHRRLDVPGASLQGVNSLRTLADARALRARLPDAGGRVAVVGAGFIGLEFAAVAARRGCAVHVIEMSDRPMARAVSPAVSDFFVEAHQRWGVQWHLNTSLREARGHEERLSEVVLSSGEALAAELLVYGIGVLPNVELAKQAGLNISVQGIVVDAQLRTSDPCISAIGDVAAWVASPGAHPLRIESVQNALDQARCLAAGLVAQPEAYRAVPWFWSDQGHLKLQIVGMPSACDSFIVLERQPSQALTVLGFQRSALASIETINRPAEHLSARRALAAGRVLEAEQAAQVGFDFKAWARG